MFFNCLGWLTYGVLIDNLFVFFGNVIPLVISVWLNMIALELQYADFKVEEIRRSIVLVLQDAHQRETSQADHSTPMDYAKIVWDVAALHTKAPVAHKTIIMSLTVVWTTLFCVICLGRSFTPSTRELIIGIAINLNLVFFYGAPLSSILTVLKTRSSATIHISTIGTIFLNSAFWAIFGFAVGDWFIAIPNVLGTLLGIIQIALCIVFPRAMPSSLEKEQSIDKELAEAEQVDFYLAEGTETELLNFSLQDLDSMEKGTDDVTAPCSSAYASLSSEEVEGSDKSSEKQDVSEVDDVQVCIEGLNDVENVMIDATVHASNVACSSTESSLTLDQEEDTDRSFEGDDVNEEPVKDCIA